MNKGISSLLLVLFFLQSTPNHLGSGVLLPPDRPAGVKASAITEFAADESFYKAIIEKEAGFIEQCQLKSGTVAWRPEPDSKGEYSVTPYFSNLALTGLLEEPGTAPAVKRYLDWYFESLNYDKPDYNGVRGTIYDFTASKDGSKQTPLKKYDSSDSYAATFISLLAEYCKETGDTQYLANHKERIDAVAGAMLSTYDKGMTYAKPDCRVQYLMDNCEVYKGLEDIAWIYDNVFKDNAKSLEFLKIRKQLGDTMEGVLWNEKRNSYGKSRGWFMTVQAADLKKFYPDATCQLYPIWNGVLKPEDPRAKRLYESFNENFPGWPEMRDAGDFPWAIIAYTAAIMGDKSRVDLYLKTVEEKYINKGHPYNWYSLEAGMTLLAASEMLEQTF